MKNAKDNKNCFAKHIRLALSVALICVTGFTGILLAVGTNRVTTIGNADIKVLGTSNLHNWTMEAKTVTCSVAFNFGTGGGTLPESLTALNLSVPVQDLKSGESSMDSRAYSALKSKKFNSIVFAMTAANVVPEAKNKFLVRTTGNLTIAGITKPVTMQVDCILNADGTITCNGSDKLKMTDYQVKPPVYMLGALKTGDELTIDFTVIVKK